MKLCKVKTEAEAREAMDACPSGADAQQVEFITKDGSFSGVRIGQLHITPGEYGSGIGLHREVLFDPASRYRVTAKAEGFPPQVHYFADYGDATAKRDSYAAGTDVQLDSHINVLVDASGNVVKELGKAEDEIPF